MIFRVICWLLVLFSVPCFGRIKFLHIPKTGGTTIHALLESMFHFDEIYPYRRVADCIGEEKKPKKNAARLPFFSHELVSGHFPFWFLEEKDRENSSSFVFTAIRDPIQRVLSHYRYRKKENPHIETSIEDVYANWQCRMLASDPFLEGEKLLESAINNLQKLDFVIFYENFEEDTKKLLQFLGIETEGLKVPKFNTTQEMKVDKETIDWIKETNKEDILLYEYAKNHLVRKNSPYFQRYQSLSEIKKPQRELVYTFDKPLIGKNWYYRENTDVDLPKYRWIDGKQASIVFYLVPGFDYTLLFDAYLLTNTIKPFVKISGISLMPRKIKKGHFSRYEVLIPKGLIKEEKVEIHFCSNMAYVCNQKYPTTTDNRTLSYALNRIEIRR